MPPSADPPASPLAFLNDRVRAVFRHLPPALAGEEEALHQLRVAARRLRVTLPLLARKPEGRRVRRVRRRLRALVRATGRGRDLDVIATLFAQHAAGTSAGARRLRGRLLDTRRRARARLTGDLRDVDVARLRRQLAAIARRGTVDVPTALARVGVQAAVDGGAVTAALHRLGRRFDAEALHRVRIVCRRLRYAAEVRAALGGQAGDAPRLLKGLQERLGAIHDAHLLAAWLGRQIRNETRAGGAELAAPARRLRRRILALARARHAELLRMDPLRLLDVAVVALSSLPGAS